MKLFLQSTHLVLTPLTPIHVGLGEDFEPTNYVIHDNVLHALDLSRVRLAPELGRELLQKANTANLGALHAFLYRHREHFLPAARIHIPVADGVSKKYHESLGNPVQLERDGEKVFNQNCIERTMYCAADGRPYLPGSSVKGALRTAWLEDLHKRGPQTRPASEKDRDALEWEREILGGKFATDPLRLLKIADFMPQCPDIDRKILFACNYKKRPAADAKTQPTGKGPSTRKEAILSGQYRAFASELVVHDTDGASPPGNIPSRQSRLADIARHCNAYHRPRLDKEIKLLRERGYVDKNWLDRLSGLLNVLKDRLDRGGVFLVRLGRYGGAENKTIEDLARIKIMAGKDKDGKPKTPSFRKESTTIWLAADQDKQPSGLLPFGWALVETDPREDCPALQKWCDTERSGRPDMRAVREKASEGRTRILARQAEEEKVEAERREKIQADQQAREEAERELAAMSPEQRFLRDFCRKLAAHPPLKPSDAGASIMGECGAFLERALTWPEAEQKQCADHLAPLMREKNMFLGKREKPFKDALKRLSGQAHG